ncbi:MAG: M18 family aminopeptidase [Clostridia bacterium]|nr:M18 family aminopeptidase [Clostridia bacterium]
MTQENRQATERLIAFIQDSPTAFHAVNTAAGMLEEAGFTRLNECDAWDLARGGKYYVTRNQSSILAFALPEGADNAFLLAASHTDSPTYKLKADSEADAFGKYVKLNVEGYGGMIASSWLDRPLSLAGRAVVIDGGRIEARLVKIDRDLVLIPNVAIHMNRNINSGYNFNPAVDLMPLFAGKEQRGALKRILAEETGVDESAVLSADLYLYNRTPGTIWGADGEFYSTPRIDNLQCAYTTLEGFLDAAASEECRMIPVWASFDNEETGSATKQGAGSQFLFDTLERIADALGFSLKQALASSFMASADNGHAKHPNHPEFSDGLNVPHMNEGVVVKSNAAQKYTTDALSSAIFCEICRRAGVPTQKFANRSDLAGGGTLGSISNTHVAMTTVDIGLAQLAMHSSYETGGTADTKYMIDAMKAFYRAKIAFSADGVCRLD